MSHYLLSIYQPDGGTPDREILEMIMRDVSAFIDELKASDALVLNAGLTPASAATVVRVENDQLRTTDGPFAEAKEHVGGFVIVDAEDRDAALEWGRKAAKATTLPIEVRALAYSNQG